MERQTTNFLNEGLSPFLFEAALCKIFPKFLIKVNNPPSGMPSQCGSGSGSKINAKSADSI